MIVVTAPTGRIGRKLVPALVAAGEAVRVVARDPQRLDPALRERVDVVVGSHTDREVVDRALTGADAVFWLMPADPRAASPYDAYVTRSIPGADAVVRHAVSRVVVVSALGRGTGIYAGHVSASHAMEDLFRSTGADIRALTNPAFMDNVLRQVTGLRDGVFTGTLPPDLRMPWVASDDIAAAAARLLITREWTGQEDLPLLGAGDLSLHDMTAILGDALDRPVTFRRGDREADRRALVAAGYSEAMAQSVIDMDVAGERGINTAVPRTPENTTPTSFADFARRVVRPAVLG